MAKVAKLESKRIAIARSGRVQSRKDSPLTPALKEFIDRAIVPVLLKQYLAVAEGENDLAGDALVAAHSVSSTAARKLRAVRL